MNDPGFCVGAVCGVLYAGVIGWFLFEMRALRVRMGNRNRPLDRFPDSIHPTSTPGGLVRGSFQAALIYTFLVLAFIIFAVAFPFGVYYFFLR